MLVRDKPETLATLLLSARPSLAYTVLADPTGAAYQRVSAGGHTMMLVVGPDRTVRRIVYWGDRHEQPGDASLLQFLQEIGESPEAENLPATPAQ